MKRILALWASVLILLLAVLPLSSCKGDDGDNDGLSIVCTVFPYYDMCKNIVGSAGEVTLLNKGGTDLHSYEPTMNDIKIISKCDIFVYGGGYSDSWVEETVKVSGNKSLKMIRLLDYVTNYVEGHDHVHHPGEDHNHSADEVDEHIWLSLKNASKICEVVYNTVLEVDSDNNSVYLQNYSDYTGKISELDNKFQKMVEANAITPLLFADRFPFRYFVEDYNIVYFAAFPGCSSETLATFDKMAELISTVNMLGLEYIFVIEGSNKDIAEAISDQTGAKILQLNSCQSVSEKDVDNGISYLSVMEYNYSVLSEVYG
jgi:zinc transport system substrate-binding protein